jgi:hypothetical protein
MVLASRAFSWRWREVTMWQLRACDQDKRKGFEATGRSGKDLYVWPSQGALSYCSEKVCVFLVNFLIVHFDHWLILC